jgi:hypothetical protein
MRRVRVQCGLWLTPGKRVCAKAGSLTLPAETADKPHPDCDRMDEKQ